MNEEVSTEITDVSPYYSPTIPGYAPFYVQLDSDASAVDIKEEYGVVIKTQAIPYQRKPKEPYRNEWYDEHGDDEYIGDTMYMESFSFTEECVVISKDDDSETARQILADQVAMFQNYLSNGLFRIYDSYTRKGFRNVRLEEFPEPTSENYDVLTGKARLIFSVTFKVNDPMTEMKLDSDGNIVEA